MNRARIPQNHVFNFTLRIEDIHVLSFNQGSFYFGSHLYDFEMSDPDYIRLETRNRGRGEKLILCKMTKENIPKLNCAELEDFIEVDISNIDKRSRREN